MSRGHGAVVEDVAAIDFINYVQADAVKARPWPARPTRPAGAVASPRRSTAARRSRPGQVTVRDVAGLYIYDNTLLGVKVTGAQVKDYLEFSAQYFKQVAGTGPSPGRRDQRGHRRRRRTARRTTTTTSSAASTRR